MTVIIVADRLWVRVFDVGEVPHLTVTIDLFPGRDGRISMCSRRRRGHWDVEIWCCDGLMRAATIRNVAYVHRKPGSPTAEWAPGEGPQVIDEGGAL